MSGIPNALLAWVPIKSQMLPLAKNEGLLHCSGEVDSREIVFAGKTKIFAPMLHPC